MTLKNSVLLAFAALTLTSITAGAYIVPGGPRPGPAPIPYPDRPDYPGQPGFPGHPGFPPPPPGHDDFGPGPGRGGRQEQKIVYLNRRIANETLALRQLAGIGENYRGYTVESVNVEVRRSGPRAELALLVDGRLEESAYSPQGYVQLRPRFGAVIGEDIRTLQLEVRGQTEVGSITINLIEGDRYDRPERPDRPGRPGMTTDIPVSVNRRMFGMDRLDLNQYVDLYRYRGFRIEEIVIDASPAYNNALLDVQINSFNQGPTLQIDRYRTRHVVRPMNAVIGYGADSIVLASRGDLDIRAVTLRLSRR